MVIYNIVNITKIKGFGRMCVSESLASDFPLPTNFAPKNKSSVALHNLSHGFVTPLRYKLHKTLLSKTHLKKKNRFGSVVEMTLRNYNLILLRATL